MKITIVMPIPHTKLSPNGRCHWRTKHKLTRSHRSKALVEALRVLDGKVPPTPVGYSIHYYWPGPHRDDDNAIASVKAYLDGICEAFRVDDKDLRFRELFHSPAGKRPRVEITLHLVGDGRPEDDRQKTGEEQPSTVEAGQRPAHPAGEQPKKAGNR